MFTLHISYRRLDIGYNNYSLYRYRILEPWLYLKTIVVVQ